MKELTRHQELMEQTSQETADEQSAGDNEMDDEQVKSLLVLLPLFQLRLS